MILPASIPNKKAAVIDQVLKQCQLGMRNVLCCPSDIISSSISERNPMACEEIVEEFNDLRSDIVLLFDLKNALNSAEYELQTSLHRLKSENGPLGSGPTSAQPLSSGSTSSTDNTKTVTFHFYYKFQSHHFFA